MEKCKQTHRHMQLHSQKSHNNTQLETISKRHVRRGKNDRQKLWEKITLQKYCWCILCWTPISAHGACPQVWFVYPVWLSWSLLFFSVSGCQLEIASGVEKGTTLGILRLESARNMNVKWEHGSWPAEYCAMQCITTLEWVLNCERPQGFDDSSA